MYLITGVAGFIGMHFAKKMLDKGYKVLGVDNLNDYYDPALKSLRLEKINGHESSSNLNACICIGIYQRKNIKYEKL